MHIQRNRNRSGTTTVRVVDRICGKFTVIHKVGTSSDEGELRRMEEEARIFIDRRKGESLFDYDVAPIADAEGDGERHNAQASDVPVGEDIPAGLHQSVQPEGGDHHS